MTISVLSQKIVNALACDDNKKKLTAFDKGCKSLVLEVSATGRKTYYFRYQDDRGVTRQPKLSDANSITLKQARTLCDRYRSTIAMGGDPWQTKAELKRVPTLETFVYGSFLPFIKTYKRSWDTDLSLIKNHIVPNFGHLYMDQLTKNQVVNFISKHLQTYKPGSVNRVIILLRYIYNSAIRWETPGINKNPTHDIPLLEENNKKERFLTKDEAERLLGAIQKSPNRVLQYIVPMLILTGARKREVLDARWEDFDLERCAWRIPLCKAGKARHVPLSAGAVQILNSVPRIKDCPWPFANPATAKPYVSVFYSWNTARKQAGLKDVRMHDLRHSFASFLVNAGRSLYEVQKLLGHTQIKTTQRYAHLSHDSLLSAASVVSDLVPLATVMPRQVEEVTLAQVASK
jgi:integrase